jgi:hypothetical protein
MTAIAEGLSCAPGTQGGTVQAVATFCGVGLAASLLLLLNSLDLSASLF